MYSASIVNSGGESLTLTQNETCWQVIGIEGLNPPPAQINTTQIAGLDGAKFNSAKLDTRNLVITLRLNGDVEQNRQNLYRFFRTKEPCTFYYSNAGRDVYIKGYCETVEVDLFSDSETMQISIICPYPYFRALSEIIADISDEAALFTFPFAIDYDEPVAFSAYIADRITDIVNRSESEIGAVIEIDFYDSVSEIEIINTGTGETMTLDYAFIDKDRVYIDTVKGQKSITLLRSGTKANLFSAMAKGSTFFQLKPGANYFGYKADDGASDDDVTIKFVYTHEYRGV